jgi:hypothetical protein
LNKYQYRVRMQVLSVPNNASKISVVGNRRCQVLHDIFNYWLRFLDDYW